MLVLSRRESQIIHVGHDITITVVRVGRNSVRIGIDAPRTLNVWRGELETKAEDAQQSKEDAA